MRSLEISMAEDVVEAASPARHAKPELDERRIARALAVALPLVTVTAAIVIALTIGAPMAILILAAGMLLGVISLFWASLRTLSGDAPLSPELEALDATAHSVDALGSRKMMLLRALKDLDNERALGKLDAEDYEQLSESYRKELRDTLGRIDATLAPYRSKAEETAQAYLAKAGLAAPGYRGAPPPAAAASAPASDLDLPASEPELAAKPARVECPKCQTSNEPDASFCKKCGASLAKTEAPEISAAAETSEPTNERKSETAE
jgi:hypothetical protein